MGDEKKYKRSHYIVEKNIQYRYVELILMHILIFFLITVAIIYFSGWRQMVQKLSNVYPQAMLVNILNAIYIKLWIGFLILLPIACISAILASHKIAGPLVRIRRALDQLTESDYNLFVKLRKGDDLQDVADQINKLAETLRKKKNV
jgi:signal transduction histidine kinase